MEEKDKKNYEIAFWLKDESSSAVKEVLGKNNCDILEEKEVQKMQLGYDIKKEKFAFFGVIKFSSYPGAIQLIKEALNLNHSVLRYMVSDVSRKRMPEGRPEGGENDRTMSFRERSNYPASFKKKEEEDVLTNEGLEKKIEEILN